jgi:diguanylate cyclase (GGDEF)-like protein/PAS domain S-box-containing protein
MRRMRRDEGMDPPAPDVELQLVDRTLDAIAPGIVVVDLAGTITYWNAGAARLLGWSADDGSRRGVEDVHVTSDAEVTTADIWTGLLRGEPFSGEFLLVQDDGPDLPVLVTTSAVLDAAGAVSAVVAVIVDLSDRVGAERAAEERAAHMTAVAAVGELALQQTSLSALLDGGLRHAASALGADIGSIFLIGDEGLLLEAAVGLPAELLHSHRVGFGPASLAGYTLALDDPIIVEDLRREERFLPPPVLLEAGAVSGITAVMRAQGRPEGVVSVYTRSPHAFGEEHVNVLRSVANVLGHAIERERAHQELSRIAITDELTGLPNRLLFVDRLQQSIDHLADGSIGVLFGDLDGFKDVNDALGHAAGDEALRVVARRLADNLRDGDTLARFGGDEFAILCEHVAGPDEAAVIARGLAAAVAAEPVIVDGRAVHMTISVGVTVAGPHDDVGALLRDADATMYRAKSLGRGSVEVFDDDRGVDVLARLELTNELTAAIADGQLVVHYQPEVRVDGTEIWAEALVRWEHPTRGLLMPDEFIDAAESTGLIIPLGREVLTRAAHQMARWQALGPERAPSSVSVNLSARQLLDPDLVALTADLLRSLSLDAGSLWFELTETAIMRDPDRALATLNALTGLGVGLAIDDFGTGYSSLTYARTLPVNALKIDRSFISGMRADARDLSIVRGVIGLARAFGVLSIAEGVETEEELEDLRQLGCDYAQGYVLCRPVPAEALEAWVRDRRAAERVTATEVPLG